MPLSVKELHRDRRSVIATIELPDPETPGAIVREDLHITYKPSAYTGARERDFNALRDDDWKSRMGLEFVNTLVTEWDLEGEDGQPYPLDIESLAQLPSVFIGQVCLAVGNDMGKAAESSNGSSR